MIKAHVGKYIFEAAQDIFKPLLVKLRKGGSSSSRQGTTPSHSSVANTIAKKLKQSRRIVTRMVQRAQDENSRCTYILLCIWSTRNYHLQDTLEDHDLICIEFSFAGRVSALEPVNGSQNFNVVPLSCESPPFARMVMVFLLKHLKNTMAAMKRSATKFERHNKEDSYKTIPPSSSKRHEVTTEESRDQEALHSINSLQSFAQPHMVKVTHCNKLQVAARGRTKSPPRKVMTKRHYTA
ncbi:hypothetical protein ACFX2H_022518 [Malus domestica]